MTSSVSRIWAAGAAGLALAAGGCTAEYPTRFEFAADRYKPRVVEVQDAVEFAPAPHANGLSPEDRGRLARAVAAYAQSGRGALVVSYPRNSGNARAAEAAVEEARALARAHGLDPAMVRAQGYEATGQNRAPVSVSFTRLKAVSPPCGNDWPSMTRTGMNEPHANFGCATNANLAAMVANPADLLGPRPLDAPDAARRGVVLETYRQGETTATERADQESGVLSTAVE